MNLTNIASLLVAAALVVAIAESTLVVPLALIFLAAVWEIVVVLTLRPGE